MKPVKYEVRTGILAQINNKIDHDYWHAVWSTVNAVWSTVNNDISRIIRDEITCEVRDLK